MVVDEDVGTTVEAEPADAGGLQNGAENSCAPSSPSIVLDDHLEDRGVVGVNSTMSSEFGWFFAGPRMRKIRLFFKQYVLLGVIAMQVRVLQCQIPP